MDINILHLLIVAISLGFGLFIASKTIQNYQNNRLIYKKKKYEEEEEKKEGVTRYSNCLSLLPNGMIRLKNGYYLAGFHLTPKNSLWDNSTIIDNLYDEISDFLNGKFPTGTVFQFRRSLHSDNDFFIQQQKLELLEKNNTHPIAQQLLFDQLNFLDYLNQEKLFKNSYFTLWVYLPLKHENQNSRNIFTEILQHIKKYGFKSWHFLNLQIVKRTKNEEHEIINQAQKYFQEIEQMCPLEAKLMGKNEVWESLYFNYNENANSATTAPLTSFANLEPLLCGSEKIKDQNNWYLLHCNTPVAIMSLFMPPESTGIKRGCYAGMMRMLTENLSLKGRFTILTEFETEDKEKTIKELSRNKWKLRAASTKPSGKKTNDKRKQKAALEIEQLEDALVSQSENTVKMCFKILLYGQPAFNKEELSKSVNDLDSLSQNIIKIIRKTWRGADIALEEPIALRNIYEGCLIGNRETTNGRGIKEQSSSLSAFVPAESAWNGMKYPHTLKKTLTGQNFGINFWNNQITNSPLICVLGTSGSGKSVECGTYVVDTLGKIPKARVKIVDFGETYAPLCEVLNGKHHRFLPEENKTINIWDYKGLELGQPPEEPQINLVVEDLAILAGFKTEDDLGRFKVGILTQCVMEVYRDFVPRNQGKEYFEPTLKDLIHKLRYFPFSTSKEVEEAAQLSSILSIYEGNKWLDAPTHPSLKSESPLEVFELDSLHLFPKTVQASLAFRTGSKVIRSIGEKIDDEYTPTLLIFDEMHEYNSPDQSHLQVIFKAMERGARKGRKTNVITVLATHAYEDLSSLHGLTKNAGMFIIGKQDNIKLLKEIRKFNDEVESAILSVNSENGSYSQFVVNVGMGENQRSEIIQSDLSPLMLWALTSHPIERNARQKVKKHFPGFDNFEVISWLAEHYPRGLVFAQKQEIDEVLLPSIQDYSYIEEIMPINENTIENIAEEELAEVSQIEIETLLENILQ